ncbi:MAG: histidinol-phosphatase HisJ family protein [Negativicutes bacterium]|nr:histidinol-phosphatase HisJ family protein [Negativicutes bacterium]
MLFDCHLHCQFSPDGMMTMEQAKSQAGRLGLGLCVTEHMDCEAPSTADFTFDVDRYFAAGGGVRSQHFLLGVELGLQLGPVVEINRNLASDPRFDFVLGSVHVVGGVDLAGCEYQGRHDARQSMRHYLATATANVAAQPFIDSFAHIDYPLRYDQHLASVFEFNDFRNEFAELFAIMVANDVCLEINTRRLSHRTWREFCEIYRFFAVCGGQAVTLGSDAHGQAQIGRNFDLAVELAGAAGLSICHFASRRPVIDRPA